MTAQEVIKEIKDALIHSTTEGVMAVLFVELPFLSTPVIRELVKGLVEHVISIALNYTALGAYDIYVDLYTAHEASQFKDAVDKKKAAQTSTEITAANEELINIARKFIKLKPV